MIRIPMNKDAKILFEIIRKLSGILVLKEPDLEHQHFKLLGKKELAEELLEIINSNYGKSKNTN